MNSFIPVSVSVWVGIVSQQESALQTCKRPNKAIKGYYKIKVPEDDCHNKHDWESHLQPKEQQKITTNSF